MKGMLFKHEAFLSENYIFNSFLFILIFRTP